MTPPSDLSTRFAGIIRDRQLFRPGDRLIIGLSGGADSTALLDLLSRLPEMSIKLIAAHLNHGLRGRESDSDEDFCRKLAGQYRIPFESRRVDIKAFADKASLNLEDAGRRARIAYFDELLGSWRATAIVLAHHADDQAETVLIRLLRGSGMTGLAGMSYRNGRGYVRPMLDITRAEIEEYLTERGLIWREDDSNRDTSFLRNRIRHELLPLLEQYNPAVRTSLAATAAILSTENDLLDEQAAQAAEQICHLTADGTTCSISLLKSLHLALQRRVIRLALSRQHGNLEQFSYHHVDAVCRMIASERPNSIINLPQRIVAVKEYETLVIRTAGTIQPQKIELHIPGPGIYQLPCNSCLTVDLSPAPADFDATGPTTAYFDLDKAPFPWHMRTCLPGDRIQLLGMSGRKRLKNLFIDSKIPLSQRSRTPLVFCGDELIWVCGLRTSQTARLEVGSSRIVKGVISRTE